MNPQIVPIHRTELREDGMLFVRTDGIIDTMANAPLIAAGLLVIALTIPLQSSYATNRTLDLLINTDGSTSVFSEIGVNSSSYEVSLFGSAVDNFAAFVPSEDEDILPAEVLEDRAVIQTGDHPVISISYDIHDLVSKEGRVWTFSFNSTTNYSLLMPENSVIVAMGVLPENMEQIESQILLQLPAGPARIEYVFSTPVEIVDIEPETSIDTATIGLIAGVITAAAAASVVVAKKRQSKPRLHAPEQESSPQPDPAPKPAADKMTLEKIFGLRPDMRDDDKELVRFIYENGGKTLESELRKKFLQPRTTMWRAVKRLERQGVVEINKKDQLNVVKLRDDVEEEN